MSIKKIRVAIVGASGYTGSELARFLMYHPRTEIAMITSETHEGKPFSSLHPQFTGQLDIPLVSADEVMRNAGSDSKKGRDAGGKTGKSHRSGNSESSDNSGSIGKTGKTAEHSKSDAKDENTERSDDGKNGIDLIFMALPHGISMEFVEKWKDHPAPIIDFSGDFRLKSPKVYTEWYNKKHSYPAGFDGAVYGLPELHEKAISKARLVANPGCYPTASILALAPLVAGNHVLTDTLIVDAKSGLTGAGIKASATSHFSNVNDNFKAYGVTNHRHTIEIEEQCSLLCNSRVTVQFTPHLLPVDRGILATVYATPRSAITQQKLDDIYRKFYKEHPFIRVRDDFPTLKDVRASNFCDIKPIVDTRTNRIIVISAIDNLVKGAAGQAVQNMNLMFGWPQETGLMNIPVQP